MKSIDRESALLIAIQAAQQAGTLLRKTSAPSKINDAQQHDIKLELDVRCQKLIEKRLRPAFPEVALLGEEGISGQAEAAARWVVDPIDGTVNFTYGIPHACVSIALQVRKQARRAPAHPDARYETVAGLVYDPFCDELWTALRGRPARLNGKIIRVSRRKNLDEAIISLGFAKNPASLQEMLPVFNRLVHQVRKIRIMGAAALALAYVAGGRFDAYLETGLRLWDIAAGGLIVECAGGEFWHQPRPGEHTYAIMASNGWLSRKLR